jgi:putative endonuclease
MLSFLVTAAEAGVRGRRGPRYSGAQIQPRIRILAIRPNGTLYVEVTSVLNRRVPAHKIDAAAGFAKRYGAYTLVYAGFYPPMAEAISREKRIKRRRRCWKIIFIEQPNPTWKDLTNEIGR